MSIHRISQETPIAEPNESQFWKSRNLGRPSSVAAYTEKISAWLREDRSAEDGPMKSTEVLARLRQMGYTGGKSAVFELVRHLQPARPVVPMVRFVGEACGRRSSGIITVLATKAFQQPILQFNQQNDSEPTPVAISSAITQPPKVAFFRDAID